MQNIKINYGAENIEDFIEKLQKYTLDPTFERYGNFIKKSSGDKKYKDWYMLFGNFYDYSNPFSIFIKDEKLAGKIRRLIKKNQKRKAYIKVKNKILEEEFKNKYYEWKNKRLNNIK